MRRALGCCFYACGYPKPLRTFGRHASAQAFHLSRPLQNGNIAVPSAFSSAQPKSPRRPAQALLQSAPIVFLSFTADLALDDPCMHLKTTPGCRRPMPGDHPALRSMSTAAPDTAALPASGASMRALHQNPSEGLQS